MESFFPQLADAYTRTHVSNPYRTFRLLRRMAPVWRVPSVQSFFENYEWVLTRHEDCARALRDPRLRAHEPDELFHRFGPASAKEPAIQDVVRIVALQNPPHHTRLRGLLLPAFTSRRIEDLRQPVQHKADELLHRIAPAGRMEAIADLAFPLATFAICRLTGIPEDGPAQFAGDAMNGSILLEPMRLQCDALSRANAMYEAGRGYFEALFEARRRVPQDDLLTHLVQAADRNLLSRAELLANIRFLFVAGHETVVGLIGNGLLALLRHRKQWEALRANPALVPNAVEEMLRYEPPVQGVQRVATETVHLNGATVRPRETLVIVLGAANRDGAVFKHPDRFDVTRENARSLCFGGGIHFCIGAQLARMEASIVLETLLRRLPNLRLARSDPPRWRPRVFMRGLESLPLVWH